MSNKDIVLVKICASSRGCVYVPWGPVYIGSVLKKNGYNVKILNNDLESKVNKDLIKFEKIITDIDPLYIGFSVSTGDHLKYVAYFAKKMKAYGCKIVFGGPHPTILPEEVLREDYVDFVVIGEGEETLLELTRAIENPKGANLGSIKGIGYKINWNIMINEKRPFISNLDRYSVDWDVSDFEEHITKNHMGCKRVLSYISSRGCPYRCAFCHNFATGNTKWRAESINTVIRNINYLKDKYDIDCVWFNDDNFFVNTDRAFEILEYINTLNLKWFGETRIDQLDELKISKIAKLTCVRLLIGVESGDDSILRYINKGINRRKVKEITRLLNRYSVPASYAFIIGFPNETFKQITKTLEFISELEEIYPPTPSTFGCKIGVYLPYPGTPLFQEAKKLGYQEPQTLRDWSGLERYRGKVNFPWINSKLLYGISKVYHYQLSSNDPILPRFINFIYRQRVGKEDFRFFVEPVFLDKLYRLKRIKRRIKEVLP